MGTGVRWLELRIARLIATRAATPVILAGTLAFAGLGAAALTPATAHHAPSLVTPAATLQIGSPHTFCRPAYDGSGHTICHILASQVSTVPNLGCYADPDGDGTYICEYATDPTVSN